MTNQENKNIWNIQFDADRNIIIYNPWNNNLGEADWTFEKSHKNITEIAAKTNILVEAEFNGIKFQVVPGMTAEQSQKAYDNAVKIKIEKQKHKKEFMKTHKENLEKSKEMTDEIRLGMLISEMPNPIKIDESHKDIDADIVSSHMFQDCVAGHTEEFSAILNDLKKSARIAVLKDKIESQEFNFDDLLDNFMAYTLSDEKGTDYNSVTPETLSFISDEFYRRHKDDMESFLGKDKLALLKRIKEENEAFAFITVSDVKQNKYRHCSDVNVTDYQGKHHDMFFADEFGTLELKKGDKLLFTVNTVDDPEFGKLRKRDVFKYDGNKYKHFYQIYYPQKDKLQGADVRNITKAIRQRASGAALENNIKR
jgi:hypothetical protein